jgi:hypothetical protein
MRSVVSIMLFLIFALAQAQSVYCPSQITCEEDNITDTCVFPQTLRGFWEWVPNRYPRPILAGTYQHTYVSAPDEVTLSGFAICVYTHEITHQTLSLRVKSGLILAAQVSLETDWRSEEMWWECKPDQAEDCPLGEVSQSAFNDF